MSDFGPPPPPQGPHDPGQPYDPQGYPGQPGYPAPAPQPRAAVRSGLSEKIGPRIGRRPEPRSAAAIAGAGGAVAVFGLLVWAATYLADGLREARSSDAGFADTSHNVLGAVLFALVTIAGYAVGVSR